MHSLNSFFDGELLYIKVDSRQLIVLPKFLATLPAIYINIEYIEKAARMIDVVKINVFLTVTTFFASLKPFIL